ncbi:hypothetical protein, partial [Aquitalea palustris]|uniref:hypothetical protein n=1 Tax=Aquitalea palustris TaxID=2480983 RepID=UPI001F27ADB4
KNLLLRCAALPQGRYAILSAAPSAADKTEYATGNLRRLPAMNNDAIEDDEDERTEIPALCPAGYRRRRNQ